jgi:predicted Zn-dependent protease
METPEKSPTTVPSQKRTWFSKLVAWTVGIAVCGVVLLILYLAVPSAYAEARIWRGSQFSAAGEKAFKEGRWEDSVEQYRLAQQMVPGELEYLRQMARASEKISVSRANDLWNDIMRRSEVSTAERQDYVEFLLRIGRIDFAFDHLKSLMMSKPRPPRSLSLASDFFRIRGDMETSILLAKQALNAAPNDAEIQFKLGSALAADVTPKERLDGRRLLWDLGKTTNSMRVDAWKRLVATGELKAGEADEILGWIQAVNLTENEFLLVADLKTTSQPADTENVVQSVVSKASTGSETILVDTVNWLNRKAAYREALSLLPPERIGTNLTLLSSRIDALLGLKRWPEIETLLSRTNSPIDPIHSDCVRALVATRQGDKPKADRIWAELVASSTNNVLKSRIVAIEAERLGRRDVALDAYRPLLTDDRFGIEANRQTYRIARSILEFAVARDAATRLARYDSRDTAAVTSMIYLNLLLKNQVRQSLESASSLMRLYPEQPNLKILTAFGYLRNDEPKKAVALVDELKSQHMLLPPQWRAITTAIMKANGRIKEQVQLLESLDNSGFNPDELKLVLN